MQTISRLQKFIDVEPDSGGVFLAVREPPTQCSHVAEPCLEVADHLGLSLATPERYY